MKKALILALLLTAGTFIFISVESKENNEPAQNVVTTGTPEPEPTPFVLSEEYRNASVENLCSRLNEIKKLPNKDPNDTDPIYEALILKGNEAVPCLIEKVSDATLMDDPRCPVWQHYTVGDTAVFVLLSILSKDHGKWDDLLLSSMPTKYRNEWKTNGIYAYFNYVSEPTNRKELHKWWIDWAKNNLKNNEPKTEKGKS